MRYVNIGDLVISIDLEEVGYEVIAIAKKNKAEQEYIVTCYIKGYGIDMLDLMEEYENIKLKPFQRNVQAQIACFIEDEYKQGKLQYYIDRYADCQKYLDFGIDNYK